MTKKELKQDMKEFNIILDSIWGAFYKRVEGSCNSEYISIINIAKEILLK